MNTSNYIAVILITHRQHTTNYHRFPNGIQVFATSRHTDSLPQYLTGSLDELKAKAPEWFESKYLIRDLYLSEEGEWRDDQGNSLHVTKGTTDVDLKDYFVQVYYIDMDSAEDWDERATEAVRFFNLQSND